jgi:hypothetical protein
VSNAADGSGQMRTEKVVIKLSDPKIIDVLDKSGSRLKVGVKLLSGTQIRG